MVMRSLREGAVSGVFKFLILGLLGMAVLGMALMDVGGFFKNGVGGNDVAQIQDQKISGVEFDNILRRQLSQRNTSPQEAYTSGLLHAVLANEIRANFVNIEAQKFGLELNKDYLQKRISQLIAPNVAEGQTMQQTLDNILRAQGLDEGKFVKIIARDIKADLITDSVKSAFPPAMTDLAQDLFTFQNQSRDIELLTFTNDSIKDVVPATPEQMQDLYENQKDTSYATPELRKLKIAIIDDEAITKTSQVSDEEIKTSYEENIENYIIPEQTIMSQAVLQNKEEAQKIFDLTQQGTSLKDAVAKISKDKNNYFENISFDMNMMMPQIVEGLAGKNVGDIVGPIETPLGQHVIRFDGLKPSVTPPLEQVKETITQELLEAKKMDDLYKASQNYDDMIAGGAEFTEISKEVPLKIYEIPGVSFYGLNEKDEDAYQAVTSDLEQDKTIINQTAFELQQQETSRVIELPSGRFAAIKVEEIREKASKPFEDVKDKIAQNFLHDQKLAANQQRIADMIKELKDKKITFKDLAAREKLKVKSITNLTISGELEAPLTDEYRPMIFKTPVGGFDSLRTEDGFAIMHINGYGIPEADEKNQERIIAIQKGLSDELKGEAFAMYLEYLGKVHPAIINENLLKQAYAPKEDESL